MTRFVAGVGTYQALALAGLIAGCSDLSSHGSDESDALAQTTDMTCGETSEDGGREADAGATADAGGGQRDGGPRRDAGGDAGARGDAAPAAMTDASRDAESVGSEDSGAAPEDGGAPTGVAIPGTWIAQIQTAGNMEVPVIGAVDADIDLIVRIVVSESNGSFEERLEFCSLQTTSILILH